MGAQFDAKELIFKNYHRYVVASDPLTIAIIWLAHRSHEPPNSTATYFDPLVLTFSNPDGRQCLRSVNLNRSHQRYVGYPGLPGFVVLHEDIPRVLLTECSPKTLSGRWKVELILNEKPLVASFSVVGDNFLPTIWTPVSACVGHLAELDEVIVKSAKRPKVLSSCSKQLPLSWCFEEVWSTLFPDTKSMLGEFDAALGSFRRSQHPIKMVNSSPHIFSIPI